MQRGTKKRVPRVRCCRKSAAESAGEKIHKMEAAPGRVCSARSSNRHLTKSPPPLPRSCSAARMVPAGLLQLEPAGRHHLVGISRTHPACGTAINKLPTSKTCAHRRRVLATMRCVFAVPAEVDTARCECCRPLPTLESFSNGWPVQSVSACEGSGTEVVCPPRDTPSKEAALLRAGWNSIRLLRL